MAATFAYDASLVGTGSYTATEAGRLLRTSALNIRRWMGGYTYKEDGKIYRSAPLWLSELPKYDDHHIEIGFRDLIELRFIKGFLDAGLGLKAIRNCLEYARDCVNDDRPFSTRKFQTDGNTIFLESLRRVDGEAELLDLKRRQYTIREVVRRTFKDLDIAEDVVARWRPFGGKASIVIDPRRAFGQPIAAEYGVPTVALVDAVSAEDSDERAARIFDVPISVVRDAVLFEQSLRG